MSLQIYPNPAQQTAYISLYSYREDKAQVFISDFMGRKVAEQQISVLSGENEIPIDIHGFHAGTYIVSCLLNERYYILKLIIY